MQTAMQWIRSQFPHTVTACSGLGSGQICRIIPWSDKRTRVFLNDYPFVGGRTPQSMDWVCVEFADGTLHTYPRTRVLELQVQS